MAKKSPPGMLIYREPLIMISMASDEEAGKTIKAAADYFLRERTPENLDEKCQMIFDIMSEGIDKGKADYKRTCERNKVNAEKRWNSQ